MIRKLFGMLLSLVVASAAIAEPPTDRRVLAGANVPPVADNVTIVKNRERNGIILPLPGLGFVPLPVEAWQCTVFHTPPRAPAGVRPNQSVVRLFTLAE